MTMVLWLNLGSPLLPRLFSQRPLKIAKANDTATCRNDMEPPNRTVDDERSPYSFYPQLYMCDIAVETCSMLRLWLKIGSRKSVGKSEP